MAHFARLSDSGLVLEVCCCEDITCCFHPDIAQEFQEVPEGAEPGDTIENGSVIKAVAPEPLPTPVPVETRNVSRAEFMDALTRAERVALSDLAADDAEVADFLSMLEVKGYFDLNNQEDIDLLDRLQTMGALSQESVDKVKQLR